MEIRGLDPRAPRVQSEYSTTELNPRFRRYFAVIGAARAIMVLDARLEMNTCLVAGQLERGEIRVGGESGIVVALRSAVLESCTGNGIGLVVKVSMGSACLYVSGQKNRLETRSFTPLPDSKSFPVTIETFNPCFESACTYVLKLDLNYFNPIVESPWHLKPIRSILSVSPEYDVVGLTWKFSLSCPIIVSGLRFTDMGSQVLCQFHVSLLSADSSPVTLENATLGSSDLPDPLSLCADPGSEPISWSLLYPAKFCLYKDESVVLGFVSESKRLTQFSQLVFGLKGTWPSKQLNLVVLHHIQDGPRPSLLDPLEIYAKELDLRLISWVETVQCHRHFGIVIEPVSARQYPRDLYLEWAGDDSALQCLDACVLLVSQKPIRLEFVSTKCGVHNIGVFWIRDQVLDQRVGLDYPLTIQVTV